MQILDASDQGFDVAGCLERDEFFWLDVPAPTDEQIDQLALQLGWHPLAVEDVKEFDQRPKLDDYEQHALLVYFGVDPAEERLIEVLMFISGEWLVTIHRDTCHALDQLRERMRAGEPRTEEEIVYRVLDVLTDSFLPVLDRVDDEIDLLEEAVVDNAHSDQIGEVMALKRRVGPIRRVALVQRTLFHSVTDVIDRMPGLERDEARNEFRDIADHLAHIADMFDGFRDRLGSTLELYATQNANRLNEVTERLTLVATIFLPLSFIVGFFGQNFGWLTSHIDSLTTFLVWGVGGLVVPVAVMVTLFARAGWLRRR